MDNHQIIKQFEQTHLKKNIPDIRAGETVKVHQKIREGNKERIQIFSGLVIAVRKGKSLQGSFTVRKVVSGIGVERTFPIHSPWITKIERVKSGKVRRAKLYFVRRHATSPKKFRLKDKGIKGTIWEEIAQEQEQIAKATEEADSSQEDNNSEEDAESNETEPTKEKNDQSEQSAGSEGGSASPSVPQEEEVSDSQD